LLALVEADRIARQATTGVQAPAATSNSEVIEHDSLDPAWEAMCEECRRRAQDPQDH
jgi:hypothetical protein